MTCIFPTLLSEVTTSSEHQNISAFDSKMADVSAWIRFEFVAHFYCLVFDILKMNHEKVNWGETSEFQLLMHVALYLAIF